MSPDRGCRNKKMRGVSRDIMGEELAGLKLERERDSWFVMRAENVTDTERETRKKPEKPYGT